MTISKGKAHYALHKFSMIFLITMHSRLLETNYIQTRV